VGALDLAGAAAFGALADDQFVTSGAVTFQGQTVRPDDKNLLLAAFAGMPGHKSLLVSVLYMFR
jgi:hypothetical protein